MQIVDCVKFTGNRNVKMCILPYRTYFPSMCNENCTNNRCTVSSQSQVLLNIMRHLPEVTNYFFFIFIIRFKKTERKETAKKKYIKVTYFLNALLNVIITFYVWYKIYFLYILYQLIVFAPNTHMMLRNRTAFRILLSASSNKLINKVKSIFNFHPFKGFWNYFFKF